ncbi:MAG: hypothetical protein ACQETE_05595 [Bacteroidota bacterium]
MKSLKLLTLGLLSAMLVLTACETGPLQDAIDDFGPIIKIEEINTLGVVTLKDMATGGLITGPVTISFSGPDAGAMVDMYSDPISEVTVENGFMNYYISNDVVPTPDDPVEVTLNITKEGYIPVTKTIEIVEEGSAGFRARMADRSNLPAGITSETKTETTADPSTGETAEPINIVATNPGAEAGSTDSSTVQIAAGSILTDADGNRLSGQLTSSFTHYSPSDPDAQAQLQSINDELSNEDSTANVIGLTEVEITDESGRRATGLQAGSSSKQWTTVGGAQLQSLQCDPGETLLTKDVFYNESVNYFYVVINGEKSIRSYDSFEPHGLYKTRYSLCVEGIVKEYALVDMQDPVLITFNITHNGNALGNLNWNLAKYGYSEDHESIKLLDSSNGVAKSIPYKVHSGGADHPVTYDLTFTLPHANVEETIEVGTHAEFDITLPAPPAYAPEVKVNLQCEGGGGIPVTGLPSTVMYAKAGTDFANEQIASEITKEFNADNTELISGTFTATGVEEGQTYDVGVTYDNDIESIEVLMQGDQVEKTVTISGGPCDN